MRRPLVAVAIAAAILAAATTGGLLLAACGSSSGSAGTAQAAGASGGQRPDMSAMFTAALDPLVQDETITSAQESDVIEALSQSMPVGGQAGQPSPAATPPSGQTPGAGATPPSGGQQGSAPDPSRMFGSTLKNLVSDGTITSAQKTAIGETLSSAMQQSGPGQQASTGSTQSS